MTHDPTGTTRGRFGALPRALLVVGSLIAALVPQATASPASPVLEVAAASSGQHTSPGAGTRGASGIGDPYWPQDGNGGYDVESYDIDVEYAFRSRRLSGTTVVTLVPARALSSLNLDLLLPVSRVRLGGRPVPFVHRGHELTIDPRHVLPAGRRVRVSVTYAGRPDRFTYDGRRAWLANDREVVTQGQPHMAAWWFPSNDHPRDKARMDISVTVPRGKQVIANGWPSGRSTKGGLVTHRWRSCEPMAPYLAFFAAGRFTVRRGATDGIPWITAVSHELALPAQDDASALMTSTGPLTSWLRTQLGPYPFGSTGGVVTGLRTALSLENQTRPTFTRSGSDTYDLVVHELAHQWFGDSVSVRSWQDIWLNEGFAEFMEVRYAETHGGGSGAEWLRATYRGQHPSFWRFRIGRPGRDDIFAQQVYDRGAMTLQALRNVVGENTFWRILRRWAAVHRGDSASIADFRRLAQRVSGRDLDDFFDTWLLRAVRPPRSARYGLGD